MLTFLSVKKYHFNTTWKPTSIKINLAQQYSQNTSLKDYTISSYMVDFHLHYLKKKNSVPRNNGAWIRFFIQQGVVYFYETNLIQLIFSDQYKYAGWLKFM